MEQVPKETGGPVYPGKAMDVFEMNERGQMELVYSSGITLRDYFAAKAMQSIVLTEHYQKMGTPTFKYEYIGTALAEDAYRVADAMLKARK